MTLISKGLSTLHSTLTWSFTHPLQRSRAGVITGNTPRKSQGPERLSNWPRQLTGQQENRSGHGFPNTGPVLLPLSLSCSAQGGLRPGTSWSRDMGMLVALMPHLYPFQKQHGFPALQKARHGHVSFRKPCSPHTGYKLPDLFISPLTQSREAGTEAAASPNVLVQQDPLLWCVPLNPHPPLGRVPAPFPACLRLLGLRVVAKET